MGVSRDRRRFEEFYRRKWAGHEGLWAERYPPDQQVYAAAVYGRRNEAILAEAGPHPGVVLDLGCGVGDLSCLLAERADRVVASDVSRENVRRARTNLERAGVRAEVLQGEGERLSFPDGTFDLVVVADVIEHVASVPVTLSEIRRVLGTGGRMICATPIRSTLQGWRAADWTARKLARPTRPLPFEWRNADVHETFLSPRELRSAIVAAGLRPLRFQRVCFYPAPETPGVFGSVMSRAYGRSGAAGFERTASRVMGAFGTIERLGVLNQKQLWVAER